MMEQNFVRILKLKPGGSRQVSTPSICPVKDDVAMNLLRLESRLDGAVAYLARLKATMTRVDAELWPQAELSQDLESLMTRLNQIPGRVQECKKSSACCGADVALSLV